MRRVVLIAVGVLLILVGVVWMFQGLGAIGGSAVSGRVKWAVIGLVVALVGAGAAIAGICARRSERWHSGIRGWRRRADRAKRISSVGRRAKLRELDSGWGITVHVQRRPVLVRALAMGHIDGPRCIGGGVPVTLNEPIRVRCQSDVPRPVIIGWHRPCDHMPAHAVARRAQRSFAIELPCHRFARGPTSHTTRAAVTRVVCEVHGRCFCKGVVLVAHQREDSVTVKRIARTPGFSSRV